MRRGLGGSVLLLTMAFTFEAAGGSRRVNDLSTLMGKELEMTRQATALERGLAGMKREAESLAYASTLLAHRSSESVRRLDAYRVSRGTHERQARRRARSLYKLARGGMLRLVFEDISELDGGPPSDARSRAAQRVTRGRTIRWLVQHDLEELSVHRRAEQRARTELLTTSRELAAIEALVLIQAIEEQGLKAAQKTFALSLAKIHRTRRRLERNNEATLGRKDRGVRTRLGRERAALRRHRGLDLAEAHSLARPVHGKIMGRFGDYNDRVMRVPMHRNGIEIRARRGESVRAVAPGKVAFVGELSGFDKIVVLDHGGGYLSLTGRMIATSVDEGQVVDAGAALGTSAPKILDDGLGRTVYLELRHGERPLDPLPLLRRYSKARGRRSSSTADTTGSG